MSHELEKQANLLLGMGYKLTENLYLPDKSPSISYQYQIYERKIGGISRATEAYEKAEHQPYLQEEHRLILDEIEERIFQVMREIATPTQLKYLEAYLIYGTVYKCGQSNQSRVYHSLFGSRRHTYGGLVTRVRKALQKDKIYLELREKLNNFI
jgi:hypothetical protein